MWFATRNCNRDEGLQVRGRWRLVVGIILALAQSLATGVLTLFLIYTIRKVAGK